MKIQAAFLALILAISSAIAADPMVEQLQKLSGKDFEVQFLQMMIAHHQDGVKMAGMTLEKAEHPELKEFSKNVASMQSKETTEMTGWLKTWDNASPDASVMPKPAAEKMAQDMTHLEKISGSEFDKMFLTMMTAHHQSGIAMAKLVPAKSSRPELIGFSKNMISTQKKEIAELSQWQKEWFGKSARE